MHVFECINLAKIDMNKTNGDDYETENVKEYNGMHSI